MLTLQGISYIHPDKSQLFTDINLSVEKHDKIALIGNNGTGKSTLLKIMAGELMPSAGSVHASSAPYYVPQLFGQFNHFTVAQALRVDHKLYALKEILAGNVTEANFVALNDDWTIEERCAEALRHWQLQVVDLDQSISSLSGGQKTRVFLAGISIHQPGIVLLDEPSNHLDSSARELLYELVRTFPGAMVIVSHDRTLLNMLHPVCELGKKGITVYGGNYDFYAEQKKLTVASLEADVKSKEKELRKAKDVARETMERQQKLDARGKKKQEKAGVATIMMNTLRNNAEKSTAKMKDVHAGKKEAIASDLRSLRDELPDLDKMKLNFDSSALHRGKILLAGYDINFAYDNQQLWDQPLSFQVISGQRFALKGPNGSGKTTLVKMLLGELQPSIGTIKNAAGGVVYIDQDYSLLNNDLSVYEQAQLFNSTAFEEHEVRIRLSRFLFTKEFWDKPCASLSGGQKMRLILCCLTIGNHAPDIIILDEPTNNLDIQNIEILTTAINSYEGTLIVVSHDIQFLHEINVLLTIDMPVKK